MNSIHRAVLKQHFRQLASDIILTDTLLGALYQAQIFERNMIDLIKAEKTEGDKVCKLLELLPKRGPDAFDLFLEVIQNDYPWLVAMLTASIKQETISRAPTKPDLKQDTADSARTSMELCAIDTDMDIKTKVSTFIHKQFGHSKRISENDKKTMIRWMSHTVHHERHRRLTSASESSAGKLLESVSMTTEDKCCGTDEDSTVVNMDKIKKLYKKLQEFKKDHCKKSTPEQVSSGGSLSCDKQTETSANQNQVSGCLDSMATDVQYLMDKLDEIEAEVNKCYLMLGDRAKNLSLSLLIYDMSITTKQKEKDLKQEKAKSEKMLNELYEYSKKVSHLEQAKAQQEMSSVTHTEEVSRLQRQLEERNQHIQKLEHLHKLHTEKQHTLENLKSMVKDLQNNNGLSRTSRVVSDSVTSRSINSRQTSRYAMSKMKTDGETPGPLQVGTRKIITNRSYKKKNNPSTYRY